METDMRASAILDAQSGVSWAAVAAGAVGAAALALLLIAFGAGLGLSAVSPRSNSGVSASTFKTGTGIYLVVVAVMSSAVGGYLFAARLRRTRWTWKFTLTRFSFRRLRAWLSCMGLRNAFFERDFCLEFRPAAYLANGTTAAVGGAASQATESVNPADIYVDKLFRTSPAAQSEPASPPNSAVTSNANPDQSKAEVVRLWTSDFHESYDLSAADKTYVAQVVAGRRRETRQ